MSPSASRNTASSSNAPTPAAFGPALFAAAAAGAELYRRRLQLGLPNGFAMTAIRLMKSRRHDDVRRRRRAPQEVIRYSMTTVGLTFDFDAVSLWINFKQLSPTPVSRGEFGAKVGVPRIL